MLGTQTIHRAAQILLIVARLQSAGATLNSVTEACGLSRTTTFRILQALVDVRWLHYDESEWKYYVGAMAYELGLAAPRHPTLIDRFRLCVDRICEQTGLTTYLFARSDKDVVCLVAAYSTSAVRAVPVTLGERLPMGLGAGGLAILAGLTDPEVRAVIAANRDKYQLRPDGSGLDPVMLENRIACTRADGFAYSQAGIAAGVSGIGLAVEGGEEFTKLALSVALAGTEIPMSEQRRLAGAIRDIAQTHGAIGGQEV